MLFTSVFPLVNKFRLVSTSLPYSCVFPWFRTRIVPWPEVPGESRWISGIVGQFFISWCQAISSRHVRITLRTTPRVHELDVIPLCLSFWWYSSSEEPVVWGSQQIWYIVISHSKINLRGTPLVNFSDCGGCEEEQAQRSVLFFIKLFSIFSKQRWWQFPLHHHSDVLKAITP